MRRCIMTPQSDSLPGNQPTLKPTRAARAIGILTVVGFRILVSRVEVGLDLESQRARGHTKTSLVMTYYGLDFEK